MMLSIKFSVALLPTLIMSTQVSSAPVQVEMQNSDFARDVYASRTSLLIIGDSTNNPRGADAFVPYFEGLIMELPEDIKLCGMRISGSTGNTGVNRYTSFSGGQTSQLQDGGVKTANPTVDPYGETVAPPGPRNEFVIVEGGALLKSGRVASIGVTNLGGLYPYASEWAYGSTLVLRTSFMTSERGVMLNTFSLVKLSDHDESAGFNTWQFDEEESFDVQLSSTKTGLEQVDLEFPDVPSPRVGILLRGDSDDNDEDESGKDLTWCDHVLFNKDLADEDRGLYFDSISIGGFTARDHTENLDDVLLDDYLRQAPRDINTVIVWLGQNAELDEWNGEIHSVWTDRIELLADKAIAAAKVNGSATPKIVLCTPPNANGIYPSQRFTAMNSELSGLAEKRGWAHLDLQTLIGQSLISIDPDFIGTGPHPSESGARYVSDLFYQHLDCIRTDYNGDGSKDFFDVSIFLEHYLNQNEEADLNGDRVFDFFDVSDFLTSFAQQCD